MKNQSDLIAFTEDEIAASGESFSTAFDAGRAACSHCSARSASVVVGPYADLALCEECYGRTPAEVRAANFGEFPIDTTGEARANS